MSILTKNGKYIRTRSGSYLVHNSSVTPPQPFSPTDIAGCQLYLKADVGITKDVDNYVSQWDDQSENGYNAVQGTGANQPLLVDNVFNNKPALRFGGLNDFMISNVTDTYTQPITIIIVYTLSGSGFQAVVSLPSTYYKYCPAYNGSGTFYMTDDSYNLLYSDVVPYTTIGTYFWSGLTSKIYKGGAYINTGNQLVNTFTGNFQIGRIAYSGGAGYLNGDIAEIIVYNKELSSTEMDSVSIYLRDKYNIPMVATNQVPKMTSATAPSGIVTSSSVYGAYANWKAFDKIYNTYWNSEIPGVMPQWICYQFTSPKIIKAYSIVAYDINYSPKDWTFEGSNDGSDWVVLDTRSGKTNWSIDSFSCVNTTAYEYYRINISDSNHASDIVAINEITFSE